MKKDRGEHHADFDRDREVEHDRQDERGEQDRPVIERVAPEVFQVVPFAHVPRDDDQDRGQRRERHVFGDRRGDENDGKQGQRVDHARDRRATAHEHVGAGARDRAGRAEAAEERHREIGDALRHELLVGIVAVVDHRVRDSRREQGLDRAEQRNRESGEDEVAQCRERHLGPGERRQR